MPSNQAAWITEKRGKPLVVKEAPYTSPKSDEVTIKNGAVAINPVDWKIQEHGFFMEEFPNILGCDVAGEIVEVGDAAGDFKKGDRVLGHCAALMTQNKSEAGFQQYTTLSHILVSRIPSDLSYAAASVLPLGTSTAAAGLFEKEFLALTHPSLSPIRTSEVVLIWGGSSSVGSCAIQLANAAGYDVFATASKRNHAYCKELGATQVFDYSSDDVVNDIVTALEGKTLAGTYDSISLESTLKPLVQILTNASQQNAPSATTLKIASTLPGTDSFSTDKVKVLPVFALSIIKNEVGPAVYKDFLPKALEQGKYLAKPDPLVVGHGLEKVQEGMDKSKAGVSAGKVVVTL